MREKRYTYEEQCPNQRSHSKFESELCATQKHIPHRLPSSCSVAPLRIAFTRVSAISSGLSRSRVSISDLSAFHIPRHKRILLQIHFPSLQEWTHYAYPALGQKDPQKFELMQRHLLPEPASPTPIGKVVFVEICIFSLKPVYLLIILR